jgi:hypothetical protein
MGKEKGWSSHKEPCSECPWRTDVETGRFPPENYRRLASTAYDMAMKIFTCHKSAGDHPVVCAGFLARGADHNLSVRFHKSKGTIDYMNPTDGGRPLYRGFREMAIANGVDPDDPVLVPCRDGDD